MSESPEVAAAREAYAKACEDFCDPILLLMEPPGYAKERLFAARKALDAALLAQRDRESDKEAVGALAAARMTSNLGTAPDIIRRLRAAGWRLVRSEPAPAPEAKASPKGQQEAVQSAKAGLYCDECGQALR